MVRKGDDTEQTNLESATCKRDGDDMLELILELNISETYIWKIYPSYNTLLPVSPTIWLIIMINNRG